MPVCHRDGRFQSKHAPIERLDGREIMRIKDCLKD
jgi:hypothetical protein